MNPVRFWFAIFAVLGIVVVAPAWMHFAGGLQNTPQHVEWLVGLMFPFLILMTAASWLQPEGTS